jgi:glycosyltransferase involved in cell wall biosynthesis
MPKGQQRIAVLWQEVTGHVAACLQALAAEAGVSLLVAHHDLNPNMPFVPSSGGLHFPRIRVAPDDDAAALIHRLEDFAPTAMLVSSWHVPAYRRALARFRGRAIRILAMDNPWRGSVRQWLGVVVAPFHVRPLFETVYLAGERQAVFARKLGFKQSEILYGVLTADTKALSAVGCEPRTPAFLFVGRLVAVKGLDTLAAAYAAYREAVTDPWPLHVCGLGPLAGMVGAVPGVAMKGFIQPADLPDMFAHSSCLVLPSRSENWGVVIHEAAAAGRPIICSTACGASVSLVLDGFNGFVFDAGDVEALASALLRMHRAGAAERKRMGEASRHLAAQYSPERWARYLLDRLAALAPAAGGGRG